MALVAIGAQMSWSSITRREGEKRGGGKRGRKEEEERGGEGRGKRRCQNLGVLIPS